MGLFQELNRRNVFRVAAAYLVTAWVVAQIADLVLDNIGAPEWVIQTLFLLLFIGFILALGFAWVYELTPEGLKRETEVEREHSTTHLTARKLNYLTIGAVFFAAGLFVWQTLFATSEVSVSEATTPTDEKTIAVLPFANMSANADNEYFADGMTEEILNSLARIDGLQVASRTSAFSFKNKEADIRAVASALRVNHVLEGSVRLSGDQIRITAQLIDVAVDRHMWSQTYTREYKDVFKIQDEIAESIADALQLQIMGESQDRSEIDLKAYDLYLLGRHEFHARTPESLRRAIELFEQSIAIESNFAAAYSGLADAYALIFQYGNYDANVAVKRSLDHATKAVRLDPSLADAHASLGLSYAIAGDFQKAIPHYLKAIELNPDYSMGHMWLGNVLYEQPNEALKAFRNAEKVDPLHPVIAENIGSTLIRMGRYQEAATHLDRAIAQNPDVSVLYYTRSELEFERGNFVENHAWARRAIEVDPESSYALITMIYAEMDLGNFDRAEQWIDRLEAVAPNHFRISETRFGLADARNDLDKMREALNRSIANDAVMMASYFDISLAELNLRGDDPSVAIQKLQNLSNDTLQADQKLWIAALRSTAFHNLEQYEQAKAAAQIGLNQLDKMRSDGWNTPWLASMESLLLYVLDRKDESIAAFQRAYDQGQRNVHGYSSIWLMDRVLGQDARYQTIREAMFADVKRQQDKVNQNISSCVQDQPGCSLRGPLARVNIQGPFDSRKLIG